MKTKQGFSLMGLVIAIVITVALTTIIIIQTDNVIEETEKNDFIVELSTIKDKIKEHYLLLGSLPVKAGEQYTVNELKGKLADITRQELLESEIVSNRDMNNTFLIVDLETLKVETNERGKSEETTDVFVVATNTLNVYYLNGVEVENIIRFSTVTLIADNDVEGDIEQTNTPVSLDNNLVVTKNTNVWTNELKITISNTLQSGETLQYSIGNAETKALSGNVIEITSTKMTDSERNQLATNKYVTIKKIVNGSIEQTKQLPIDNLDVLSPTMGNLEMIDTSNEDYNVVKINSADEGESGIKCLYYDYLGKLGDNTVLPYYSARSVPTLKDLMRFGKITNDGTIILDKNIKSIIVTAVDNAGNASNITTYTIDDIYLISK